MSNGSTAAQNGGQPESRAFWVFAIAAGVVALVSAWMGWRVQTPPADIWGYLENALRSLHALFLSDMYFASGITPEALPWLTVARTAGAAFSLLLALRLIVFALGARATEFFLGFRGGHDLVIGEGVAASDYSQVIPNGKLTHLVQGAVSSSGRHARLRRSGTLEQQLRRGNAGRARRILVDEGDDADTWQTAQEAARRYKNVDVLAHIQDTWMLERLSRAEPEASLRPFSYAGGVARQIMLAHPPYLLARAMQAPKQHIVLIGFGSVGQALLRECLITSVSGDPAPIMVTVIDPRMTELRAGFEARHPGLSSQVDVALATGDLRQDNKELEAWLAGRRAMAEICAVYVAIDDAHLPLSAGLAIKDRASRLDLFRAPIFLCADRGAGLPMVRDGVGLLGARCATPEEARQQEERGQQDGLLHELRLVSFGRWEDAFDGAGLMEPELDGQARRLHETYERLVRETSPASAATARPWATLSDEFRSSNRRAAAHIRAKVDAAGFDLAGWLAEAKHGRASHELPPAADAFRLDDREFMNRMGELEHRRWMIDRLLNGWRLGPRDNRARLHPDLRPFADLGQAAVGKDDNVIATTVEMLSEAGRRHRRR